jgi:hypothetical protein
MTTIPRPVQAGSSARIEQRQDQSEHLQRLLAYSYLYRTAQRWHRARAFGTFVLATVAPIVSLLLPSTSAILAAIAAGWLVAGRTILSWLEDHGILRAVSVQELYDTRLFRLPWNTALAGRQPVPEDVLAAAAHIRDDTGYRNWYSIDLGDTPWPGDTLLCQRMSMIWSRRDHRAYGTTILVTGIAWFTLGLAVALARGPGRSSGRILRASCGGRGEDREGGHRVAQPGPPGVRHRWVLPDVRDERAGVIAGERGGV